MPKGAEPNCRLSSPDEAQFLTAGAFLSAVVRYICFERMHPDVVVGQEPVRPPRGCSPPTAKAIVLIDMTDTRTAQQSAFRADVLAGLSQPEKSLPSRWLYDDRGSELFERITAVPEYYVTRAERRILEDHAHAMADFVGPEAVVVEYGAGASVKTEILLSALAQPVAYVPIDIAGDFLYAAADRVAERFPNIALYPVVADFTQDFDLPPDLPAGGASQPAGRSTRMAFFPGSTIGNLGEAAAASFLRRAGRHVGRGGTMILGADLRKSEDILIPAYDDAGGVTAAFNLNLLTRINRELDGTFDLDGFHHEARWNNERSAVEMHLVSDRAQSAKVDGKQFTFDAGETIHTEDSRKYAVSKLKDMAGAAGWAVEHVWQDENKLFGVLGLRFG